MSVLPFSKAADNNKTVILEWLTEAFASSRHVLEIGSGTGQHAVHFAGQLPHLIWQTSDLGPNLDGISARLKEEGPANALAPLELDVASAPWPLPAMISPDAIDGIFTANTLHIMSMAHVECFFERVGEVLKTGGTLCVYGPMKYGGAFTTPSNEAFDAQLKSWDQVSGIRDFEVLDGLAQNIGLELAHDHAMPANNQLLIWTRTGSPAMG